jgi:hypothetical protein
MLPGEQLSGGDGIRRAGYREKQSKHMALAGDWL